MKTIWNRRTATRAIAVIGLTGVGVLASAALAAGQSASPTQVTFTKDIAPILQRSCQRCHRPNGGMAPMALTTYEEVRPWARAIKTRTSAREMPPWFIEKNVGIQKFKDDPSLSDAEIATLAAWVDAGAPQGKAADMPPPRVFAESNSWTFGEPDLVVTSPMLTTKAVGGDFHTPYIGSTPSGLTEDRWVAAVEVREFRPFEKQRSAGRPGGGNDYLVLHHQSVSTTARGDNTDAAEAAQRDRNDFNYLYEVGQNALFYPADLGVPLPAGSTIHFNGHHSHSIGKEIKYHIQAGFKFHPKGYTPKYPQGLQGLSTPPAGWGAELDIPGNTDNVRYDRFWVLDKPARMVTFEPHLHASGKRMCIEAIHPNGTIEVMNCAGYNHAWVKSYVYDDDYAPLLPKGTIVHVTAWYDNTAKNPRVVDPRNWRGLGHRSIDDMLILISKFVFYSDEEFKAELAAREAKRKLSTTTTAAAAQNNN